MRRDFKADVAISTIGFIINRPQHIGGHANIFDGQRLKQRFFGLFLVGFQQFAQRIIVTAAVRDSLLENSGVAGQAAQACLRLQDVQFSAIDEIAADRVQPDGLAALQQLFNGFIVVSSMPDCDWVDVTMVTFQLCAAGYRRLIAALIEVKHNPETMQVARSFVSTLSVQILSYQLAVDA